jgi:hypothetical protein
MTRFSALHRARDWVSNRKPHTTILTSSAPITTSHDIWKYSLEHVSLLAPWGTPWSAAFAYTTTNPSMKLCHFVTAFLFRFERWMIREFPARDYAYKRIDTLDNVTIDTQWATENPCEFSHVIVTFTQGWSSLGTRAFFAQRILSMHSLDETPR